MAWAGRWRPHRDVTAAESKQGRSSATQWPTRGRNLIPPIASLQPAVLAEVSFEVDPSASEHHAPDAAPSAVGLVTPSTPAS
jgi:hypothetical protein